MRSTSFDHEGLDLNAPVAQTLDRARSNGFENTRHGVGLHDFAGPTAVQQPPLLNEAPRPVHDGGEISDLAGHGKTQKAQKPQMFPCPSSVTRCGSFIDEDEAPPTSSMPAKVGPVSWSDLPSKRQLAVLTMARLSEPLTQTSLQAYMFYQLRSFDPTLPDSTISSQAGMLQGSFTAAQTVTAILWGRIADSEKMGRKRVLLIGLFGTCISCLGFGFSKSFVQAAVFRTLGGALNGNVPVMRTMISEIIREKKFQSRAFLILPMCFNIGVIIGPVLGGLLSDPVASYPAIFGAESVFGGEEGVWWLKHWPYALPNLMSALFLLSSATGVIFGLEETLDSLRDRPDSGLRLGRAIADIFRRLFRTQTHHYTAVHADDTLDSPSRYSLIDSYELEPRLPKQPSTPTIPKRKLAKLPISRIWTRNVLCTLLCHCILALHIGTFNNLWFIHLSTSRFDPSHPSPPSRTSQRLPFSFTGGLGMLPRSVGVAMAVLGVIGISLQLLVYPTVNAKLGTIRSFRYSLCLFPLAYTLAPYLSIIPSSTPAPSQASGFLVWLSIAFVLLIQVVARTFALPATIILINNCSPHPSVLGTIHGIAQSISSASRTIGPVLGGWGYGKGLQVGVVGMVWWSLAVVACVGWCVSSLVREGSGHEILLEGEEDKEGMGDEELRREGGRGARPGFVREMTGAALR